MKNAIKFIIIASAAASISAMAQQDIKAAPGYSQATNGTVVRSGTGLCWHVGTYAASDAIVGCDKEAPKPAPVVVAPVAAPAPAPVVAAPKPVVVVPPAPVITTEKVSIAADTLFDYDKADLKPASEAALADLVAKLNGVKLEVVIATGHTDSKGADAYNQKLSVKRAESVKAFLVSKGIDTSKVFTEGKGETQPVADNKTDEGRQKNRRVDVEVVGTRTVTK
jgi:OmpA-OmpF porin, OOP family